MVESGRDRAYGTCQAAETALIGSEGMASACGGMVRAEVEVFSHRDGRKELLVGRVHPP